MENLNSINWNEREKELQDSFSDRFRKVWLSHTRLGSICITVFPINQNERYIICTESKVQNFSLENLKNIVLSQI